MLCSANKQSDENIYIKSLLLNKQNFDQTTISHKSLIEGAVFDYELGDIPNIV
jgi:putative alpha-1,2-mannosidase